MAQEKYDVFISYSRNDSYILPAIKEKLADAGISFWLDIEMMTDEDLFDKQIIEGIHKSRIVLWISSQYSNQSEWCSDQIAYAYKLNKPIIPFRIDRTPYNMKVMLRIADLSYIEYYANHQKALDNLVDSVKAHLNSSQQEEEERKRKEELRKKEEERLRIQLEAEQKRKEEEEKRFPKNEDTKRFVPHQYRISIFIGGSKKLDELRDAVRSVLNSITARSKKGYVLVGVTYEDFGTSFIQGGRQKEYMKFIREEADYAIFILDSQIVGAITFEEFEEALNSYKEKGNPHIFVYNKNNDISVSPNDNEYARIRQAIDEYNQYYIDFNTKDELKLRIKDAFSNYR